MNVKKIKFDKSNNMKKENNIMRIIKGSLLAIIITIMALLIFSAILAYTNVSENVSTPVIFVIMIASVIVGGFVSLRKCEKNGLINGAIVGLIYILIIYILSSVFATSFGLNMYSVIMMIFAILAGILGGIIGVNI